MPPRSSWKGYLKCSLVSVPVKAYTATSGSGKVQLNQLHAACHSRIKHQKVCPIHGQVSQEEIVSGYEFASDQYVIVEPDELDQLRLEADKSVQVDTFVEPAAIDPVYHSGKTYYLVPDGPLGQKPYALLRQSMQEENLHAVAQVVISNKEQLVLIRPLGRLLAMTVLEYEPHIKNPALFEDELPETQTSGEELELTKTLIGALCRSDFCLTDYRDLYNERLAELVEAKVTGREIAAPPSPEPLPADDLMGALKDSIEQAQGERGPPEVESDGKPPAGKMAASKTARTGAAAEDTAREQKKSG